MIYDQNGSPPRMRGTVKKICFPHIIIGITPADAGNSGCGRRFQCAGGDHPRGCGEQIPRKTRALGLLGSPPRMRGTVASLASAGAGVGITPADAGNRAFGFSERAKKRDHPRGCGEQGIHSGAAVESAGSPPRMRGPVKKLCLAEKIVGITPADAGNRENAVLQFENSWDHPRGCGEQKALRMRQHAARGSPPRMRGTVGGSGFGCSFGWDHPRGCGEQQSVVMHDALHTGSPPRMRGTASWVRADIHTSRITPADAGNSYIDMACAFYTRDHPRGCGEQDTDSLKRFNELRITPADAGNRMQY